MNKTELIEKVSSTAEITKAEAMKVVNATLEGITEGLVALVWAAVSSYFFFDGGAAASVVTVKKIRLFMP